MNRLPGPKLSIAMIVRNAAESLAETLDAIEAIADEVVIVDNGSTDETATVAARPGVRFCTTRWQDDFSLARNEAASLCTGEWILWLDAGERMTPEAAESLQTFVKTAARPNTAYMLLVQVPAQPGEIAGEQVGAIRLVPNDPTLRFVGRVRETLLPALNEANYQVEGLPQRIQRGAREHDENAKVRRAKRNIQLAELEMRERGPQATLLNCLGDAFLALRQNERAANFFRQAIGYGTRESSDMLASYYGLVMALEGADQGRMGQLNACIAALEIFPLDAQLLCATAGYLQSLGKPEMALRAYETAHRFGQVNPEVWHLCGMQEVAASCYAQALARANQLDASRQVLEEELSKTPDSMRLRKQLLQLCVHQGDRKGALEQVDLLPAEVPYREALKSAVRGAALAHEGNWTPALAYLEAAYRNGCRDLLCLEFYATALMEVGDIANAAPVLAQWRAADPQNPKLAQLVATASQGERSIRSRRPAVASATLS